MASLICSASLQREISDSEMQTLEQLIAKWQEFLGQYISFKLFSISEHFLGHIPMVVKVLLIFQHKLSDGTNAFALCQIYQNVMVSTSGIPGCYNDNANSDTLNQSWVIDVMALEDILVFAAILDFDLSGKLFFVWHDMRRVG